MSLADRVLQGDRLALSRLVSLVEDQSPHALELTAQLFSHSGQAYIIGITGAPGTGKSTLVNHLTLHLRRESARFEDPSVAVVAVDPSSPFTGGAILGDRIRMRDLAGDPEIFIRSMASRGALGGLSRTTSEVVEVLDAAGFEIIIIETVGAGQAEVDIASMAHTTVVIDAPGLGDGIQALKAGMLEVGDVVVVNKADLPGSDNTYKALKAAVEMGYSSQKDDEGSNRQWVPPVLKTTATTGKGISELADSLWEHNTYLHESGEWVSRERKRIQLSFRQLLQDRLFEEFMNSGNEEIVQQMLGRVLERDLSPRAAVQELINRYAR